MSRWMLYNIIQTGRQFGSFIILELGSSSHLSHEDRERQELTERELAEAMLVFIVCCVMLMERTARSLCGTDQVRADCFVLKHPQTIETMFLFVPSTDAPIREYFVNLHVLEK